MVDMVKDGRVFVQPFSTTENGFDISDGLPAMLPSIVAAPELGAAVVEALDKANRRLLPPVDPRAPASDSEFLALTGFKSYAHYSRGVRAVSLRAEYDGHLDSVRIVPMRGERGGFVPITEEKAVIAYEGPEQLGRAVQEAMKKATR